MSESGKSGHSWVFLVPQPGITQESRLLHNILLPVRIWPRLTPFYPIFHRSCLSPSFRNPRFFPKKGDNLGQGYPREESYPGCGRHLSPGRLLPARHHRCTEVRVHLGTVEQGGVPRVVYRAGTVGQGSTPTGAAGVLRAELPQFFLGRRSPQGRVTSVLLRRVLPVSLGKKRGYPAQSTPSLPRREKLPCPEYSQSP